MGASWLSSISLVRNLRECQSWRRASVDDGKTWPDVEVLGCKVYVVAAVCVQVAMLFVGRASCEDGGFPQGTTYPRILRRKYGAIVTLRTIYGPYLGKYLKEVYLPHRGSRSASPIVLQPPGAGGH